MKTQFHTRREFLKTSTLAAASLPFVGALTGRAQTAAPAKKLGVALAGLGSLSTHQIAPALQKTNFCRLTGIITGTPAKAEHWKAEYGFRIGDPNQWRLIRALSGGGPLMDVGI
jgi:hypothetical protein